MFNMVDYLRPRKQVQRFVVDLGPPIQSYKIQTVWSNQESHTPAQTSAFVREGD